MPPDTHAQIRSINLDGGDMKVVARGIRQVVGMDWHPVTKQLYFTENQRDWLSEEFPEDKLNRLTNPGKDNFGFPYCHQGNMPDPEFGWGHDCKAEFTQPLVLLGPHSAPLGMRFYTSHMFPAAYRCASRFLEQEQQVRRRHRRRETQQGRHCQVGRAIHHRVPAE